MGWFEGLHKWVKERRKRIEKERALLSLREALILENYEKCRNIIAVAQEYGAEHREIRRIILEYCRSNSLEEAQLAMR